MVYFIVNCGAANDGNKTRNCKRLFRSQDLCIHTWAYLNLENLHLRGLSYIIINIKITV